MRKIALLISFSIGLWSMLNAQWTSPGNGTTYTMSELVNVTDGVVTFDATNYHIHADLTIAQNDVLKIDNGFQKIYVEEALITINGSMISTTSSSIWASVSRVTLMVFLPLMAISLVLKPT